MSDEEHHFDSKADAGASKTYPQQAGTIRKNGYIVIKSRPCKVPFSFPQFCVLFIFAFLLKYFGSDESICVGLCSFSQILIVLRFYLEFGIFRCNSFAGWEFTLIIA